MYAGGWRFVLYAPEMLEGMRRVLLCMLEAVEGELCLLEVPEVQEAMRSVLLCIQEAVEVSNFAGGVGGAGGDALCATLYAGGCGG